MSDWSCSIDDADAIRRRGQWILAGEWVANLTSQNNNHNATALGNVWSETHEAEKKHHNMKTSILTPAQAAKEFTKQAKAICLENSIDFAAAWHQAKSEFPELHAAAFGTASTVSTTPKEIASEARLLASRGATQEVAIPNAANIAALGLPADATYEEFMAAHRAAKTVPYGSPLPIRKNVIFSAIVKLYGGTPDAEARAKRFFLRDA